MTRRSQASSGEDDSDLVAGALEGSERAYHQLVLRYQRPIFSLIVRMVRDAQLAEDLSQEVFVKAFRALSGYDHQRKFSSWLFKIAHNATIDHLRKGRIQTVPLEDPSSDSADWLESLEDSAAADPLQVQERSEVAATLEAAIAQLRPVYREVMLLRHREELSYQEIAEVTGLSLAAVKTNLHRARKELAELLRGRF